MTDQTAITETSYAGNYIYEEAAGVEELKFFNQPEGYVEPEDAADYNQGFSYIYQYKDHLGNIRLSYTDANGDGDIDVTTDPNTNEIVEENNYYPFGLNHKGYNGNQGAFRDHKYGFGGKEEQDDNVGGNQLNWLDFGARNYDAALGRWMNLDPLADDYSNINKTPYQYCSNNPINRIDPDGRDDWIITKENKLVRIRVTNDKFHKIYKVDNEGRNIPFYKTNHKLLNGVKETKWSRIHKEQDRIEFISILDSPKNKEAIKSMRKKAIEAGFVDSFDILLSSTRSLNVSPTDRGDPDRYSVGHDLFNEIFDYFKRNQEEKETKKEKSDEDKNKAKKFKQLVIKIHNDLEEGKYTWNGSEWVRE